MKRTFWSIALVLVLGITVGCTASSDVATPASTTVVATPAPSTSAASPTLELVGNDSTVKKLSLEEIKKLPATEGYGGIKSSTGKITPPAKFKGVLLEELCQQIGGLDSSLAIGIVAKDGYEMTMSYDQITKGDFIAYDVATGDEKTINDKLQVLIAYEMDGQPLNTEKDGTFRVLVISPKNNQVTDGHWSVKWVTKIALKPMTAEWSLKLCGAIQEVIDRGSFESCAAPACHGNTWKDAEGQEWSGVPLYVLAGAVDDELEHDTGAYNRELADKGYQIEVIGADGAKTILDSTKVKVNRTVIVAHKMNDAPLQGEDAPLRLVGPDLTSSEMVSEITEIKLNLP